MEIWSLNRGRAARLIYEKKTLFWLQDKRQLMSISVVMLRMTVQFFLPVDQSLSVCSTFPLLSKSLCIRLGQKNLTGGLGETKTSILTVTFMCAHNITHKWSGRARSVSIFPSGATTLAAEDDKMENGRIYFNK